MGYGEVLGNASVHWRVLHEEYEDQEDARPLTAAAAPAGSFWKKKLARARLRTADVPPDRPAQHVANLDVLDYEARGTDTLPFSQIGRCNNSKDHPGVFRVTMRFQNERDARRALEAAKVRRDGKMFAIVVDVPAIDRAAQQVGPPSDPPAEVRIDW